MCRYLAVVVVRPLDARVAPIKIGNAPLAREVGVVVAAVVAWHEERAPLDCRREGRRILRMTIRVRINSVWSGVIAFHIHCKITPSNEPACYMLAPSWERKRSRIAARTRGGQQRPHHLLLSFASARGGKQESNRH